MVSGAAPYMTITGGLNFVSKRVGGAADRVGYPEPYGFATDRNRLQFAKKAINDTGRTRKPWSAVA
jgi:hypothetical protein